MAHIVYALYALGYFVGITTIIGLIIAYIKRGDVRGHWLEAHYTWQIRTFWWSLLFVVIGSALTLVFIGWFVLIAAAIWGIYRLVKGWIALSRAEAMANPTGLF